MSQVGQLSRPLAFRNATALVFLPLGPPQVQKWGPLREKGKSLGAMG